MFDDDKINKDSDQDYTKTNNYILMKISMSVITF